MEGNIKQQRLPLLFWGRVMLWFFYVYLFVHIVQFEVEKNQNLFIAGLYLIEFGVHELSHIITAFLPPILTAAAGSVGEISLTMLVALAALKERSYFAFILALQWFGLAMNSVGRYIADARTQTLPLIGPSETATHDWHYILSQLGILQADVIIGTVVRGLGDIVALGGLLFGLWILVRAVLFVEE
jgi:hypothetical protein